MGMLEQLITELKSRKLGDVTLYFDKDDSSKVRLIEQNGMYTYMISKPSNDGSEKVIHILKTELEPGKCIDCIVSPNRMWVIPDVMSLMDAAMVPGRGAVDDVARLLCDKVFEVVTYTMLENPSYKGSNFSNSAIMVAVENSRGERFLVRFLVGNNVHGCDEEIKGNILGEAFQFSLLGSLDKKGYLYVHP